MGISSSPKQFSAKIYKCANNLSDPAVKRRYMMQLSADMDKIFMTNVYSDLHKDHFTNWSKATISPSTRTTSPEEFTFGPRPKSFGPTWVAEYGRNNGPNGPAHGPMQGPKITSGGKSGIRKISRAKRKKWNGVTKPMHTWTKTVTSISEILPPKIRTECVKIAYEVFK